MKKLELIEEICQLDPTRKVNRLWALTKDQLEKLLQNIKYSINQKLTKEEKKFEKDLTTWLEGLGVYPLKTPKDKMKTKPIGYYEKRYSGDQFKSSLPQFHIVVNGKSYDVELSTSAIPNTSKLEIIKKINEWGGDARVLFPSYLDDFKKEILCKC